MLPLAFGLPGGPELLLILLVVILFVGARKLPELARAMGTSITQFKKGLKDDPERLEEPQEAPETGAPGAAGSTLTAEAKDEA